MSCYTVNLIQVLLGIFVTFRSICAADGYSIGNSRSGPCLSPSGNDCDWYSRCFETGLKQCNAAATNAGQFCRSWETNRNALSQEGRRWIELVKSCQQKRLAPLLDRNTWSATCDVIRDQISTTQTSCYVSPSDRSTSVCDLPLYDYYELFIHAVRHSITSDSVCEAYDVLQELQTTVADD